MSISKTEEWYIDRTWDNQEVRNQYLSKLSEMMENYGFCIVEDIFAILGMNDYEKMIETLKTLEDFYEDESKFEE